MIAWYRETLAHHWTGVWKNLKQCWNSCSQRFLDFHQISERFLQIPSRTHHPREKTGSIINLSPLCVLNFLWIYLDIKMAQLTNMSRQENDLFYYFCKDKCVLINYKVKSSQWKKWWINAGLFMLGTCLCGDSKYIHCIKNAVCISDSMLKAWIVLVHWFTIFLPTDPTP